VAISNHRLLSVDDSAVTFRTKDKKTCRLAPLEFMRRFLQHVLPRGFVKIRHFGLYAAGNVNTKLAAARTVLEAQQQDQSDRVVTKREEQRQSGTPAPPDWRALLQRLTGIDVMVCPECCGPLRTEGLAEIWLPARSPPLDSS